MLSERYCPFCLGVAEHCGVLGEDGLVGVIYISTTFEQVGWHTDEWRIVTLIEALQHVAETLGEGEVLGWLPCWSDGDSHLSHIDVVLVLCLCILEDCLRVSQGCLGTEHLVEIVVGIGDEARYFTIGGEVVRTHEWRLDESECVGCSNSGGVELRLHTCITKVAGDVGVHGIETGGEPTVEHDVGIESDVEAIHVVLAEGSSSIGVTYGEVVVCHVVTTLDVEAIVLSKCLFVGDVLPIRIVMIHIIIIIVWIGVEELELVELGSRGLKHLGCISAILGCVHHVHSLRQELHAYGCVEVDACCHGLVALGVDENHTIGCLGTIDSGSVLEHFDGLDVVHVDGSKEVVEVAKVNHFAIVEHVVNHSVEHNQRLCIGIEGIETVDEHGGTLCVERRTGNAANIGTQAVANLIVDGHVGGCLEVGDAYLLGTSRHQFVVREIAFGEQLDVHVFGTVIDGGTYLVVSLKSCLQGGNERRNLDGVNTFFVRHGCVERVVVRLNLNTRQRFTRSSIHHLTFHFLHRIILDRLLNLLNLSCRSIFDSNL